MDYFPSLRPDKEGGMVLCHSLLTCMTCGKKWQRDMNGVSNIGQEMVSWIWDKHANDYLEVARGNRKEQKSGFHTALDPKLN
jgi:transposase